MFGVGVIGQIGGFAGSGGGAGVIPDFIAQDGVADGLFYNYINGPNSIYDAGTNCVFVSYQAWSGADPRLSKLVRVNLATRKRDTFLIDNRAIVDDSHGNPVIAIDSSSYIHCVYGPHNGTLWYATSDQPVSATGALTFSRQADIPGSSQYTYGHILAVGNDIYLFPRINNAGATTMNVVMLKGTPSGGVVSSWTGPTVLFDMAADSRTYFAGQHIYHDGTKIFLPLQHTNYAETWRRNIYAAEYVIADGSVSNLNGDVVVAAASLPVTKTQLDTSFRVENNTTDTEYCFLVPAFDGTGIIHEIIQITLTSDGTLRERYREFIPGVTGPFSNGWQSLISLSNNVLADLTSTGALVKNADGTFDYYYIRDPTSAWSIGGNLYKKVMTKPASGGVAPTFGSETLIRAATSFGLKAPQPIRNGPANAKIVFYETTADEATESGQLKVFIWGDNGFL